MNTDTVKAVQDALAPVAQKLGEGAAHLYEIYVRQMFIEGVTGLVSIAVFTLFTVGFGFFVKWLWTRYNKSNHKSYDTPVLEGVATIALGILVVICLVCLTDGVSNCLGKLVNPEYYAVERLLVQVRGEQQ